MTMRVAPILGGAGQIRELEVRHSGGVYRGFSVQVFEREAGRWVEQYVNGVAGRFVRLEGEIESAERSLWRTVAPDRRRDSRLVSERLGPGRWRRTMSVSEDGGASWRVLWTDALERAPAAAPAAPAERTASGANAIERDLALMTLWTLILAWVLFGFIFLLRRRAPGSRERKRDPTAMIGLALQGLGFVPVWSFQRNPGTPFVDVGLAGSLALSALTVALMFGSLLLTLTAVRRLGKQWSFAARLVDDHELVTDGPYALVRHPIYTGMLGMLLATGLAVSRWYFLLVGAALYWIGTVIRTRVEERLLRSAFGAAYDDYTRRVPALVPLPHKKIERRG
jgi:protein-S-isoprenylcysteine O-methyltransferase Ste14